MAVDGVAERATAERTGAADDAVAVAVGVADLTDVAGIPERATTGIDERAATGVADLADVVATDVDDAVAAARDERGASAALTAAEIIIPTKIKNTFFILIPVILKCPRTM